MFDKVKLNYIDFPKTISSADIKIDEDKNLELSPSSDNQSITLTVKDNSFGAEYLNTFDLDYETAKDFYSIFYKLLNQIKD